MEIKIQKYRGQTIIYDDLEDKFCCQIELNDNIKNSKRASLKDVRKAIDQFIKDNLEFKPFDFFKKAKECVAFEHYRCIAIRTDGKFLIKRANEKFINSGACVEDMNAMVYDPEIVKQCELAKNELDIAEKAYLESVKNLYDKLVPLDLSLYKSK